MNNNKKSLNKFLSLVISMIVLIGTCTFSAVNAYTPSIQDENVYSLLKQLNIIDTVIDPEDGAATRENFAVYVANMLNIGEGTTSKRYFADVENTAYSSKAINTLAEMGIISASPDKYFNPGTKITMYEAIKMLVCAIGAKDYAEAKGGYPYGYTSVARELGIYSGSDSQTLTTSAAASLIYKAMTIPIVEYDGISSDSVSYKKSDENILSMYWNIKYSDGVITSVYGITIKGEEAESADEIAIDGKAYKSSIDLGDTTELIGEYVDYFYYDNKNGGDKQIMFMSKNDNSGKERLCIDIDDFESYTDSEITYSDPKNDGKSKKQALGAHKLLYNGVELGSDVGKTMSALNKGFIYNDWCAPKEINACSSEIINTAYLHKAFELMSKIGQLLGKDYKSYTEKADAVKYAWLKKFWSKDEWKDNQTFLACALYHNFIDDNEEEKKTAERLAKLIEQRDYHLEMGIFGIKYVFTVLSEYGYGDVLYKAVANPTYPSYAYWINSEMTTLCESWNMGSSLNHHMFSEVDNWFYKYLAGINVSKDGVIIKPIKVNGVNEVKAQYREILVNINNGLLKLTIPDCFDKVTVIYNGKEEVVGEGIYTFE